MCVVKRIAVFLLFIAILFSSVVPVGAVRITTVIPFLLGDVDGDGYVTIIDVTCIQRRLVEIPVKNYNESAADADGDGIVTILDATWIQRYLVQLPCPAGIGEPIS